MARASVQTDWYRGIALSGFNPALLSIIQLGGVVRLEGRSRTKRPRLAGCKGRGRWRRVCLMRTLGGIPAAIVTGVDRIRCPITQIFHYRLTKRHCAGAPSPTTISPLRSSAGGARRLPVRAWHQFRRSRLISRRLALRLLDHAREVRDRLFVDGRRLRLSRLPDFRHVAAGQDREETRCHSGGLFALWTNAIG